ncbi:MAG: trigger factor [Phycisphaerae bacterium]
MADEEATLTEPQTEAKNDLEDLSEEEQEQARLAEAVSVQAEDIGTLRKKLTVTIEGEYIETRRSEQFDELRREAQVHGFRRGRAPLRLIQKRFGKDVGDQLTGPLVGNAFLAALEKEELKDKTIGDPRICVQVPEERTDESGKKGTVLTDKLMTVEEAVQQIHLPDEGAFSFDCEVELRPEFDLPELKGIALNRPTVEITDDMIAEEIDRIRATRGQYAPVADGKVKADDLLVADYKCTVGDRVLAEEPNRALPARDQRLEGINVEGLGKALVGKKVEATVTVEAKIPEDHAEAELRGQTAKFELTLRDIKRLELPELDAAFLESLGVDSEQDLRDTLRQELEFRRKQMTQGQLREQIRTYLAEKTKLEIPSGLSQRVTDRAIARRMMELYRMGIPPQEVEKQIDGLKATASEEALSDLKLFFIMEKVADELETDVSEEELNGAIAGIAQRQGRRFDRIRDELAGKGGLENLYVQLRDEKIMDKLIEQAKISDKPAKSPKKSSAKKTSAKKSTKKAAKKSAKKTGKAGGG